MQTDIFSSRLRETRGRLGLTQKQISEKAGISSVSYSAYESGTKMPPLTIAVKLANAMGVSLDWLCGLDVQTNLQTYADVARTLVSLDSAIDLSIDDRRYLITSDEGYLETERWGFECLVTLYRDATNDDAECHDDVNGWDGVNSMLFRDFLQTWVKTRPLIKSGDFDYDFFAPWLKEQYRILNIRLPHKAPSVLSTDIITNDDSKGT